MIFRALIPVCCFVVLSAGGSAWAQGSCCSERPPEHDESRVGQLAQDMRPSMHAMEGCCDEPVGEDCPCDSGCEDCSCTGCEAASAPGSPGAMSGGVGSWPVSGGGEVASEIVERVTALDSAGDLLRPPIA